ncbi:hypothetical protein V6N13_020958 [Hibiscus sabdariffa]|uniref:Cytochrome P450 n=1 Tax=Hibiscus sabdariffa TaxID=183260 RepID=A0ABR2EV14_9ROSI
MFAVDGDKWKEQRKFASYEFSTRVLRDFSCSVFSSNAAKLVLLVSNLTANALSWFFYALCKNPLIQEKAAREVIEMTGADRIDDDDIDDFMASVTDATLEKMHYLHAALSETLRLYPAVPHGN